MADYQKMYLSLFRKVTKAITLLQQAQIEAEEIFLLSDDAEVQVLPQDLRTTLSDDDNNDTLP